MANGIRIGDPRGFNKGRSSKFRVGSRVRQTPKEGRRTYRPKRCGNNNKDEDNSHLTITRIECTHTHTRAHSSCGKHCVYVCVCLVRETERKRIGLLWLTPRGDWRIQSLDSSFFFHGSQIPSRFLSLGATAPGWRPKRCDMSTRLAADPNWSWGGKHLSLYIFWTHTYEVHTISFQTFFFVWALLLIVHTWNASSLRKNLLRL